ncbi:hypothetical protein MKX03_021955 [Papaver bracteatum]|nr:hypothetical protein MKX03_021955 [Papaver bracteatum]
MHVCCELFREAGCDNLIFQHASVGELPIIQWCPKPEVFTFLKQCEEAQNPELLQKSANLGHVVAAYVLGIMLIDAGDDEEDVLRGKQLLTPKSRCMSKRSRSGEIQECRKKAKKSIGGMWANNSLSGAKKYSCNNLECTARNQTYEADNECETCNCNIYKHRG